MSTSIKLTLFIVVLTSAVILYFHFNNSYRKIERYYYNTDKNLFVLLEISLLIMVISLMFNLRHVILLFILPWQKRLLKKLSRK